MVNTLPLDPSILNQTITLTITPDGVPRNVRIEVRYLEYTRRWYMTLWDADTGDSLVRYVPVLASESKLHDLFGPYGHLLFGSLACLPVVKQPDSPDPGKANLGQFQLLWGDRLDG